MNPQVEIVPSDAATEQTSLEQHGFTRRQFIAGSAATLAIAAAGGVSALEFPANAEALTEAEPLGGEWIRTTCSPNCTGACGINAWVQDGQVRLLKQAADYPYEHYNPRGCLKGLSINTILHGPDRLTKPLVKNEDGEQIETDWDTALDTAADKLREIAEKYGPDSIGVIYQVQGTGHIQKGALVRIANTFGWSIIGGYELNGDLPCSGLRPLAARAKSWNRTAGKIRSSRSYSARTLWSHVCPTLTSSPTRRKTAAR